MVWFWFFARVMTRVRHCLWRVVPVRLVVMMLGGWVCFTPGGVAQAPGGGYKSFDLYHAISLRGVGLVFAPPRVEVVDEGLDRDKEPVFAFGVG